MRVKIITRFTTHITLPDGADFKAFKESIEKKAVATIDRKDIMNSVDDVHVELAGRAEGVPDAGIEYGGNGYSSEVLLDE